MITIFVGFYDLRHLIFGGYVHILSIHWTQWILNISSPHHSPIDIVYIHIHIYIHIYIYMLTPPPDTYFLLLIPSFLPNYICAGSKSFARTMWVTCLRERGFKRMKLWRLCTKCCVTSSHLGKLQQVLCTNHGYMLEGGWVQKDEAMTLKSEVKSELKSELMSQETQYQKLSGNLGSWILGSRNRDYDTQVWSQVWTHVSRNSI